MAESKLLGLKFPEFAHLTEADLDEIVGTAEELAEMQRQFRANVAFVNSECVRDQYAGEWVAVRGGEILAHGDTWESVRSQAKEQGLTEYWLTEISAA